MFLFLRPVMQHQAGLFLPALIQLRTTKTISLHDFKNANGSTRPLSCPLAGPVRGVVSRQGPTWWIKMWFASTPVPNSTPSMVRGFVS
jgi:hypothetical protein